MKTLCLAMALVLVPCCTRAQGTFVYDQQAADENHYLDGGTGLGQQPLGQSFAPSLDTVESEIARERVALDVKAGDTILFGKYSGQEIKLDGVEYLFMKEDEVLAAIDDVAVNKKK